jgi:hypothetical protein
MGTKKQNSEEPKSCVIANPIYDTVFKKLMENKRIAKFFLRTLLSENIISVNARPQKFTYRKKPEREKEGKSSDGDSVGYSIFRIDFMATIETGDGEWKKILIEVQKSWDETDVIRFRNYLAEQYSRVDRVRRGDRPACNDRIHTWRPPCRNRKPVHQSGASLQGSCTQKSGECKISIHRETHARQLCHSGGKNH